MCSGAQVPWDSRSSATPSCLSDDFGLDLTPRRLAVADLIRNSVLATASRGTPFKDAEQLTACDIMRGKTSTFGRGAGGNG
ncbi:hypothetical protein SAMN00790413_06551 [Deinococcus hopiensis KR-140]|uniref:Uncharacterized protein n=1 Tax=Deinococcus hopiensis KR-140 TaxID=695939 RepID=A0A1W1UAX0_9DEIO|nr:hypothetical protein SAMN00790413_06551 [Deinococcus hopiensis KR-140]